MGWIFSKEWSPTPPPPTEKSEKWVKWGQDVKLDWSPEGEANLRRGITEVTQRDGIVVILFGQTGFGKSSLANGIQTAMRGNRNVSHYFPVGIRTHGSYTKDLQRYDFCRQSCRENCTCEPYFWLIDMPGVFNSDAITDDSIEKIVTGAVPFYKHIKPTLEVMDSSSILPPQDRIKASCVVLVQKAGVPIADDVKRQIQVLLKLHSRGVLSVHVILTYPDAVELLLRDSDKLEHVFDSEEVRDAVEFASKQIGLPQTCISVVKNYTVEKFTNTNINILHLHALENILLAAKDTYERDEKKKKMESGMYARTSQPQ